MVNYPSQLTPEEKALRKRYTKLQEKTKELKEYRELQQQQQSNISASKSDGTAGGQSFLVGKNVSSSGLQAQAAKESLVNPKDAREAARKLLESGKLSIVNKRAQQKTTGFKRVGETTSTGPTSSGSSSNSSSSKGYPFSTGSKRTSSQAASNQPIPPSVYKPKPVVRPAEVKQLYSRFVKASDTIKEQKIPKFTSDQYNEDTTELTAAEGTTLPPEESTQDSTVYISWRDVGLTDTALREALTRFGSIRTIKLRGQKEAFVTFQSPNIAKTVQREMNKGMIHGLEIRVEPAGPQNGYIELPPNVEDEPWARISAGIDQLGGTGVESQSGRKRTAAARKPLPAYEQDF